MLKASRKQRKQKQTLGTKKRRRSRKHPSQQAQRLLQHQAKMNPT